MVKMLDLDAFLQAKGPILDVRAPREFAQGRLPQAHNLPLFDDDEHAEIGTLYKQVSPEASLLRGLELVGPKMASFVRQAQALTPEKELRIHCWRGGNRSGSMAWLLEFAGFKVTTLRGGYKAFRREMRASFGRPWSLIVLGGMTGSAKTQILQELRRLGEQVVDLEDLAQHRGSAFGALGYPEQPSVEQFENLLGEAFRGLDPQRVVWLEDESKKIGCVALPYDLRQQMHRAPLLVLDVARDERVAHLLQVYASYPPAELKHCVSKLRKRLGGLRVKECLQAIDNNELAQVAHATLDYYDRTYRYGLSKRPAELQHPLALSIRDLAQAARQIRDFAQSAQLYPESPASGLQLPQSPPAPLSLAPTQGDFHVEDVESV